LKVKILYDILFDREEEQRVNFTDILRAPFYKSELSSFSLEMFDFVLFWRQNIDKKHARKILMKLARGCFESVS